MYVCILVLAITHIIYQHNSKTVIIYSAPKPPSPSPTSPPPPPNWHKL